MLRDTSKNQHTSLKIFNDNRNNIIETSIESQLVTGMIKKVQFTQLILPTRVLWSETLNPTRRRRLNDIG